MACPTLPISSAPLLLAKLLEPQAGLLSAIVPQVTKCCQGAAPACPLLLASQEAVLELSPSSKRFSLLISGLALWCEILFAQVAHTGVVQQLSTHGAPGLLPGMPLAPRTPGFIEHPAPQRPSSTARSSEQNLPCLLVFLPASTGLSFRGVSSCAKLVSF